MKENTELRTVVEANRIAIKALEQSPCEDVVNRILKRMWNCRGAKTTNIDKVKMEQIIREELFSTYLQESKTGHWIAHEIEDTCRWLTCSECGYEWINKKLNFCPNCGARMIESQESEDEE